MKKPKDIKEPDLINHPTHYQSTNGLEVIDVIEEFKLSFYTGNVIKYILRIGKKDKDLINLKKARWYLNRYIQSLEPTPEE